MAIRKIDKNIGTVPVWGEDNFDANVHENFSSLKEIVPQVNNSIDDMNVVIEDLNSKIGTVDNSVVVASQAKLDAVTAAEAAILAKNEAQSLYDNFDDRYLGPFLTEPTLDNDGQPLKNGALYYLYTESPEDKGKMYIYDLQRAEWIDISYIPTLFSSLTDILFAGLETGDILKYDKTLGKWQNIPRDYYTKTESDNKLDSKAELAGSSTQVFKVADAEADSDAVNKLQMNTAIALSNPTGLIIPYPAQTAPEGYLKCNGALISRITYASLFAVIGTTFGAGNGTTTFALPDLRAEFIRGWDDARGIDSGRVFGSSQNDEFKTHNHKTAINIDGTMPFPSGVNGVSYTNLGSYTSSSGGSETRPRNIALHYCIKY